MNKTFTNKLSIYLIKEKYSSHNEILKEYDGLKRQDIGDDVGTFYYGASDKSEPKWINGFFAGFFNNEDDKGNLKIFAASSKAIFLVSTENRTFALTFGFGYTLLQEGTCEERFGLKVVLNLVEPENLRSIDKKNMSIVPKHSKEQLTKEGTFTDFGINIEQDLIQGVTGKLEKGDYSGQFGTRISGADSLHVSVKKDISDIEPFLNDCFKKFNSVKYKEYFDWIDNISAVKDPNIIQNLDHQLVANIKEKKFEKTWMAVPKILNWEDVSEFKFKKESFGSDIDLMTYLEFLSDKRKQGLSLNTIKKNHKVDCISKVTGMAKESWSIYKCLYCEAKYEEEAYILNGGEWYKIDKDFANVVFKEYTEFRKKPTTVKLLDCNPDEKENDYNERVAKNDSNICNMDSKNIYHGGKHQKIEFCDLLRKDKKIIHVKHYGASSVLSHLFSQGSVSGELFLFDPEFRKKVNEKLESLGEASFKPLQDSEKPNAPEYEIVFAIISKEDEDLDIPFFSKVNIRNAKRRLENFGYKVSLLKISTEPAKSS